MPPAAAPAITLYQAASLVSLRTGLDVSYKALYYSIRDRTTDPCPVKLIYTRGRSDHSRGILTSDYLALERWYLRERTSRGPLTDDQLSTVGGAIEAAPPQP